MAKPEVAIFLGLWTAEWSNFVRGTAWEGRSQSVRTTYPKMKEFKLDPEYRRTRETRWEAGGPTLQAKILPDDR